MPTKVDLKKSLDGYRATRGSFRILEVPDHAYLMVDGRGDPNTSQEYARALAALYPLGYALKFASKAELGRDYVVPPLEGLWWAEDMDAFTVAREKSAWSWTMMLLVPDWIEAELVDLAFARARSKGRNTEATTPLDAVRLETLAEGLCVQTLHVGSYDDEGPVLARLHEEFIPEHGLALDGRHHEVYLSDPRRVAPERLRTVLRQPVVVRR